MESGGIPKDLFLAEENVLHDARETVGFSRNQFGEYKPGSADTTATEARIVAMASEIRVDERRDMVADLMVDVVSDMHNIIFSEWKEPQVVDIAGPQGVQLWVEFTGDMLRHGTYEVKVDPDSSVPETKAVREQKAIQTYQILMQNPTIATNPLAIAEITRFLMREMNNVGLDDLMSMLPDGGGVGLDPGKPMNVQQFGGVLGKLQQAAMQRGGPAGGGK